MNEGDAFPRGDEAGKKNKRFKCTSTERTGSCTHLLASFIFTFTSNSKSDKDVLQGHIAAIIPVILSKILCFEKFPSGRVGNIRDKER